MSICSWVFVVFYIQLAWCWAEFRSLNTMEMQGMSDMTKSCCSSLMCVLAKLISRVRLVATSWTLARLLCPWDSAGKNTGVGCHAFLRGSSHPRIKPSFLSSPALTGRFFYQNTTWEAHKWSFIPSSKGKYTTFYFTFLDCQLLCQGQSTILFYRCKKNSICRSSFSRDGVLSLPREPLWGFC